MENRSRESYRDQRSIISRVVLIVFFFVLSCVVAPSLVGEKKGIPSTQWYGYAVIFAGISALIAGRIVRHNLRKNSAKLDEAQGPAITAESRSEEVDSDSSQATSSADPHVPQTMEATHGVVGGTAAGCLPS